MGLRAEEKGSEVIDVVSSNPKVAKYDIVPSTEWERALSCINFKEFLSRQDLIDVTNLDAETQHIQCQQGNGGARFWADLIENEHKSM